MTKQLKEYETETRNLRETIERLENHLSEQIKLVEEEKWKNKQHEKKLEAVQEGLLNEQKMVMEKLTRERLNIDKSKDDILFEQKKIMQQVYEEKRKLAEEKAQLELAVQTYKNQQHNDSMKNINVEAEISVATKYLKEEKLRLDKLENTLKVQEEQLSEQKKKLDERVNVLNKREAELQETIVVTNQKYLESQTLYENSKREADRNLEILKQSSSTKNSYDAKLQQIQNQLMQLNEKENSLNKEKIAILRLKQEFEMYKDTIMCSRCKSPVRNFENFNSTSFTSGYGSLMATYPSKMPNSTKQLNSTNYTQSFSMLNNAKQLRQLKLQAIKDRQYLNQEKEFIGSLRSSLRSKAFSFDHLNTIGVSN